MCFEENPYLFIFELFKSILTLSFIHFSTLQIQHTFEYFCKFQESGVNKMVADGFNEGAGVFFLCIKIS